MFQNFPCFWIWFQALKHEDEVEDDASPKLEIEIFAPSSLFLFFYRFWKLGFVHHILVMYNMDYIMIFSIKKRKRKENRLDQIFICYTLIWSFNPNGHSCNWFSLRMMVVVSSIIAHFATNCTIQLCNYETIFRLLSKCFWST